MMSHRINRRQFTRTAIAASTVFAAPAIVRGRKLNEKLNIAIIGVGGRGAANTKEVASENIVALCDVSDQALSAAVARYPKAKTYIDFRKMFDDAATFDAVVVSTCEHTHAFATMLALKHRKHVYCEKPLTHNIWEARKIREAAAEANVTTQMGIQIHATENYRQVVEIIQSGAIGPVREVHVWVNRARGLQSKEDAARFGDLVHVTDRPAEPEPIPPGLHWDLWLGPAPERPFHSVYYPGPKWYRWWDFGNGTMSDLGSHWNDLPFWALKLKVPKTVEAFGPPPHPELAPATMRAVYEFASRDDLPAVTLTWYQGNLKPEIWHSQKIPQWKDGCLFVGEQGMLLSDYGRHLMLPEDKFADYKLPAPTLRRSPGHHQEWIDACKAGKQASADFEYSGWLTEANHLGNVAYRTGKKLEWDPATLKATNAPEADAFIQREYRKGWVL